MQHSTFTRSPGESPFGRILKIGEVARETSLHRATIYRRIKKGEFPNSVNLGGKRVGWLEHDIDAWKANLTPNKPDS